jgi:cyclophilin family peptidyl-prolyl cis-trans isomerase
MIQGGDPNSRSGPISTWGMGNPSQPTVNAEFSTAKHLRGTLSAARSTDTNSATSQFFICVAASAWLNGAYSVYGRTVSGINFVDTIVNAPRDANDNPLDKIEMFITYVGSNDSTPNAPILTTPTSGSYAASTSRILKWAIQPDGIIYTAEVATDSLFTNIIKTANLGTNQYNVTGLSSLTKYFWRVKTNNGGHFSTYSDVWHFYVSATGVEDIGNDKNAILVSPNPSKGLLFFENIAIGSFVEIMDVEGKVILRSMVQENKMSFDLSQQAKGIYFYKAMSVSDIIEQGKVVIE